MIGFLPAWRALPASVGSAVEDASKAMDQYLTKPVLTPADATPKLVEIQAKMMAAAGKATAEGNPAAMASTSGGLVAMNATNAGLSATWATASAVPGGQPAANQAYTEGMKAAAGAAAAAAFAAIAAITDQHICPIHSGLIPHGPGMVTKGSGSVLINNLPASRQSDKVFEACGGADPIAMGCPTVDIGD